MKLAKEGNLLSREDIDGHISMAPSPMQKTIGFGTGRTR